MIRRAKKDFHRLFGAADLLERVLTRRLQKEAHTRDVSMQLMERRDISRWNGNAR